MFVLAALLASFFLLAATLPHTLPRDVSQRRVVVYYQTQFPSDEGGAYVSPLPLTPYVTHLNVAAFHINENASLHLNNDWYNDPMYTQMWADVHQMQSKGITVMGMLGGAGGDTYTTLFSDFSRYYSILADMLVWTGLDGLDIDVEENVSTANVIMLIRRLRADYPNMIISLAPVASALSTNMYKQIERQAGTDVAFYNAQFYNGFGDFTVASYQAIIRKGVFPAHKLVAGTITDDSNVSPVEATAKSLVKKFPDFGGVAAWEYFDSLPGGEQAPWEWAQGMQAAMA